MSDRLYLTVSLTLSFLFLATAIIRSIQTEMECRSLISKKTRKLLNNPKTRHRVIPAYLERKRSESGRQEPAEKPKSMILCIVHIAATSNDTIVVLEKLRDLENVKRFDPYTRVEWLVNPDEPCSGREVARLYNSTEPKWEPLYVYAHQAVPGNTIDVN